MSLAARLAAIIVLALLATLLVDAVLLLAEWPLGSPPPIPTMAAGAVRMLDAASDSERLRLIAALPPGKDEIVWHRDPPPSPARDNLPIAPQAEEMRRAMEAELGDASRPVMIGPGPGIHLEVQLADGSWLALRVPTCDPPPLPWTRLPLRLALAGAVIAAISLWAARCLSKPLAEFARAVERFGRDTDAASLPECGPKELRRTIRAFNAMQERLRRFIDDRTRMLAAMSHDLRTPLTRLRLRAEFVEDAAQQRRMLADLDAMSQMVEASLAFLRDDAAREKRVPTDLAVLLQGVCEDAADAGQDVACGETARATVVCGPAALRRALINLLDNAVIYGQRARAALRLAGPEAIIEIEDDGPGIPPEAQEAVFQPFHRLEASRSAATGGIGLGLAVARSIIRGHGGEIALANRREGGTRVSLRLPLAVS
jgi:signal transduction histidine kinase